MKRDTRITTIVRTATHIQTNIMKTILCSLLPVRLRGLRLLAIPVVFLLTAILKPVTTCGQVRPCLGIDCPRDILVECASREGGTVTFPAPMVQNTCGSQVIVGCKPTSGSVFAPGTNVVNCEVIDNQRNSARCSFRVIVQPDTTRPNFATPAIVEATCTSPAGATVNFAVEAVDECDASPTVVCAPASGSLFPVGTTIVNCVATDDSGNSTTASFPVKVGGTCDPACVLMQCPRDIEATLRSGDKQAVRFRVTATNLCDRDEVTVICDPPSGSLFSIGETAVQCVAKIDGVEKRCSFKVTVRDVTPPWLIVPNDFVMECQGFGLGDGGGATVPFQVKATDNSLQNPNVTCTPASGSWLRLGTNTITCVASDSSGNKTTNSFAVTVKSGPKCQVEPVVLDLAPDNWGFELGLIGWLPSGAAFEFQPVVGRGIQVHRVPHLKQQLEERIGGDYWEKLQFRIGVEGKQWIGTADNYAIPPGELFDNVGDPNEALLGEMLSKPFTISNRFMTFLIGGTDDMDRLRVELLVATATDEQPGPIVIGNDRFRVEHKATGHGRELMRRVAVALDSFGHHVLGRRARIRIVDNSPAGHLNVDDFQFVDIHPIGQRVTIGGKEHPAVVPFDGFYYDWDSPVWGFADLHTHPMSHLGFAEKVMHGTPDGGPVNPANIAAALGDCRCTHGGWGPGNECGDFLREAMMLAMDAKGNYTHREGWSSNSDGGVDGTSHEEYARFRHWPVFSTIAHQQMWYEWIKRSYDGGLRVMVALCVNNPLLGSASKGDGPIDDYTVGNNQIRALTNFVARHDDFMEIALDPFELRDILRRNKLAIIIGSELDDIGNFAMNKSVNEWDPTDADKDKVRAEINRLYGLGMRYIFPVHLMDNKFGGTPIVNPMLNMASKFLNGRALEVIPADPGEHITYWFPEKFDLLVEVKKHELEIGFAAALLPVLAPFLPAVAEAWGGVPLGGAAGGLMPLAMLASVGALGEFGEVIKAVPPDVWPIGNNYPTNSHAAAPWGHKNARGLTPLGRFAVTEMMKRGMMIDVDHMGQRTIDEVFDMAEANSVGYPLNSGHNSFRDQATEHRTENQRTGQQMARIRKLGGLFGVGYENSSQYSVVAQRQHTVSQVDNNCGGTSKTVSQIYLQALEYMNGENVALGTDINGLIAGPGPRFGPNSAFGTKSPWYLEDLIRSQRNGVLYEPMHGRPIVGPAFLGHGVDPGQQLGWGRDEYTVNGNLHYGYTYSQDQRDFFAAIRIFYHFKKQVSDGFPQTLVVIELAKIRSAMSSGYNAGRVHDLAYGLIKGIKGWPLVGGGFGGGLIDDTASRELMGRLVFQTEVLDSSVPADLHQFLKLRLSSLRGIWNDYHHIFGGNTPLKRSKTGPKDWDINFDGVAHYGLLPDLFQDMTNVGLEYHDLNPLFHSGDDFARMWTKCLNAADAMNRPGLRSYYDLLGGQIEFTWFGEIGDRLEETDDLSGRGGWREVRSEVSHIRGLNRVTVQIDRNAQQRFYRVKKP